MNYDKIIKSTYNWISVSKILLFVLFFWLALPVLFFVPIAFELNLFFEDFVLAIQGLYLILYFTVLLGFIVLTCFILGKDCSVKLISITRYIDTIFLVLCELFYIFIWNKNEKLRFSQILLIFGTVLLFYYNVMILSTFIFLALIIFIFCYFLLVLYNFLRLSFSLTLFYHKPISIKEALNLSWGLTHKKTLEIFFGYFFNIATVIVMFFIISVILAAIANLFLVNFLNISLAYNLSIMLASVFALGPIIVAYYFGFMEMYFQLVKKKNSELLIKKALFNSLKESYPKVKPKSIVEKKPKSFKKPKSKKSISKKSTPVKKVVYKKKPTSKKKVSVKKKVSSKKK
jgi:uncharacterized membrane protein YciS (DUF1049 family)